MKPVLFASTKPLERAENIRALYDAFDGGKVHIQVNGCRHHPAIRSGEFDLMVIDELPTETPGKCIMVGHGISGGKTYGLDQPKPYYRAEQAGLIDRYIVSGTAMVKNAMQFSGLPKEKILPLGLPRTDAYKGKRKGDGQTALAGKRSYLYVPTFRAEGETPLPEIDWNWIDGQLNDSELLAVKAHTMSGDFGIAGRYRHIMEINPYLPSAPFLTDCDVVITDYSSILFDGYLLKKPGVLFEKQKGYTETRGMYLDYPQQYCSRYCTDEQELLNTIREANELTVTEYGVLRLVADGCDGHATERICRLIHSMAG